MKCLKKTIFKILGNTKRIDNYILKKSEIAGNSSPENSYVRSLIENRTNLNNKLTRRF